jgi:hypothetical protein
LRLFGICGDHAGRDQAGLRRVRIVAPTSGGSPLPSAAATALLAGLVGLAVVLAVVAAGTTVRRDIT